MLTLYFLFRFVHSSQCGLTERQKCIRILLLLIKLFPSFKKRFIKTSHALVNERTGSSQINYDVFN